MEDFLKLDILIFNGHSPTVASQHSESEELATGRSACSRNAEEGWRRESEKEL